MRCALAALIVGSLVMLAAPAGAHSTLVSACPGPGDVLNEVTTLELEFASPLIDDEVARLDLLADGGQTEVRVGPVVFSEDLLTISTEVLEDLEPGQHIVRYLVTSADGDENDGGFEFTLDPDASPNSDTCADLDDGGGGAGGWIILVVGVVGVGALVFFLRPKRSPKSEG
ncbi:MAG: copper resistance CopC family protein [Acidimicrobiales bacterium]